MTLELSRRSLGVALAIALAAALVALGAVRGGHAGDGAPAVVAAAKPRPPASAAGLDEVAASTAGSAAVTAATAMAPPGSGSTGPAEVPARRTTTSSAASPERAEQREASSRASSPPEASSSATSPPNLPNVPTSRPTTVTTVAVADADLAARVVAHHNRERAGRGLPPLQRSACLDAVALAWATHLASIGELRHNPASAVQSDGCVPWEAVGENIGFDGTLESLAAAWMASAIHQDNILDARFTHVGVGVVRAGDVVWVVVNFIG